jgi:endonuclease/exonuclease/phosphatase family metal-dependent hydrolase
MTLSLLQLNMNGDTFWDTLIPFLTSHDFDIIQLQEVCGENTISGTLHSKRDCFQELQQILGDKYKGELAIAERYTSSPTSYMGNATFYKNAFTLSKKHILPLYQHPEPFSSTETTFEKVGRALLHLTLDIQGKPVSFLNTHFAWAKTSIEQPHHTEQGEILFNYLQSVPSPFLFSGDMNLNPNQPIIQKINTLAQNLTSKNNITNTLNPRTHRAKELFPKGIPVDYIFVSNDLTVKNFAVIEDLDLSDHFGLTAEIEI